MPAVPEPSDGEEMHGEETLASTPLPGSAPADGQTDDLERLLTEEEEIERRTKSEHHETPHFRKESD